MIYETELMAKNLKEICPKNIAVAYVGRDWAEFVESGNLRSFIVSPTLGSNPAAIVEIGNTVGWDNLWLLDGLHSKIYIGEDAVMLGSANLSKFAFEKNNQEEICAVLHGTENLKKANEIYASYIKKAKKLYPDEKSKRARIEKLRKDHRRAISWGGIKEEVAAVQDFGSYKPDRDGKFNVAWYFNLETKYTESVPFSIQNDIEAEVHLSPEDLNPENEWILCWLLSPGGNVDGRSKPFWVYVHEIFENGTDDEDYEKLCIQRSSRSLPTKPFDESDPLFFEAFRKVMNRDHFSELREGTKEIWCLKDLKGLTGKFIFELKKEYGLMVQT